MKVIGVGGPIELDPNSTALLYESVLFDRSTGSESKTARITLDNRWEVVRSPNTWLDNLVGSLDAFELELKTMTHQSVVLCLHSNDLLLRGSVEFVTRFKSILSARKGLSVILSVSAPANISSVEQGSEYLASHVHYGSARGELMFGVIGPLLLDSTTTVERVQMYTKAQSMTGDCLLLIDVKDIQALGKFKCEFNLERSVIFGLTSVAEVDQLDMPCTVGVTCPSPEAMVSGGISADTAMGMLTHCMKTPYIRPVVSTGTHCKTNLKMFGGQGFEFFASHAESRIGKSEVQSIHSHALSLLAFRWNPPKLDTKVEEQVSKWVCDICGLSAGQDEHPNYTKLGFTYCSIACLSDHRKRGFAPLP